MLIQCTNYHFMAHFPKTTWIPEMIRHLNTHYEHRSFSRTSWWADVTDMSSELTDMHNTQWIYFGIAFFGVVDTVFCTYCLPLLQWISRLRGWVSACRTTTLATRTCRSRCRPSPASISTSILQLIPAPLIPTASTCLRNITKLHCRYFSTCFLGSYRMLQLCFHNAEHQYSFQILFYWLTF